MMPDEDSSKSGDSGYVSDSSFSERAVRCAPLTGLLLLVLIAIVHAFVFYSKGDEYCFRTLGTYSLLDYVAYSLTPSAYVLNLSLGLCVHDEFWIATFYGIGMFTVTFMMVYLNSAIPGVQPPLPWDSPDGTITVSYAMCPMVGLMTFWCTLFI